jgi:hypothetical protein
VAPAPSSSIGTLTFPVLAAGHCTAASPNARWSSVNDISGLSVNQLQLNTGVVLGNAETFWDYYSLSGEGITLGSGGLSASSPTNATLPRPFYLKLPITLGASQTWSLTGPAGGVGGNVSTEGLAGSSADLTVNLSDGSGLYLQGDNEVGNVSVTAGDTGGGTINFLGAAGHLAQLDASDGHNLTVGSGIDLAETNTALGGLVSAGGIISVGWPYAASPGTLSTTSASFDASSNVGFEIAAPGTTVGTDYAQLTSTGPVNLGGATGELYETIADGSCPALTVGTSYTLISTTGSLSGQFGNAPEGGIIHDGFTCNNSYRINYHESGPTQTVTATVVSTTDGSPPSNSELPQISGTPAVGESLTTSIGAWSGDTPQDYSYEWLRDGNPIAETDSYSYVVTTADEGHQLAVRVTASNANGSASATSAAVSVVGGSQGDEEHTEEPPQLKTEPPHEVAPPPPGPPLLPPVSCCDGPVQFTPAQTAAFVAGQLVPSGKTASIGSLLKHGGLSLPFTAPSSGSVTIEWFELPAGATLSRKTKVKAGLVAKGQGSFVGTRPGVVKVRLTAAGRKLLGRSKRLKVEAKGSFVAVGGKAIGVVRGFVVGR